MRSLGLPERVGFEMNKRNYYAHHMGWRRRNLRIGQFIQGAAKLAGLCPLTRALERRNYRQHHMDDWTQLAESLGLTPDFSRPWLGPPEMDLVLPEKAPAFFERNAGRKIWLLHPGAAREARRWPHYQELVKSVFSPAQIPLVILEDPAVPRIAADYDSCLMWPMSSLADVSALAAHCDRILCNDSAAAHVGAALKKHVVTIFGPGSSDWFAPYTPERTVIESFVCPYRPCIDRCVQPRFICLDDVSFDRVVERITPLF
jgi:ADP-heptose:LPS heptosyltransferase